MSAKRASQTKPILIVEDDLTFGGLLAANLAAHGYRTETSLTVEAAIDQLSHGLRPSLVLLDINLPGDTGWALLRGEVLRVAGDPPVVAISAIAANPRRLAQYHLAGYLPKPFAMETLLATVERLHREGSRTPESEEIGEA
jgi:DNA-binding response OmpR family regulator